MQIRKENKLSQEKFAERLGLSRNFINQVECGKKNFSDRTIRDISEEFNISEEWIRYGTGCKWKEEPEKFSDYIAKISNGDDTFIKDIIEVYMELDDVSRQALRIVAKRLSEKLK
jgi:transcriptional regulator with XRE-family HTH domain